MSNIEKVVYGGQCHCGAVKFRVRAPKRLVAWLCNCSICEMKKNTHFVVPFADFILLPLAAHGGITTYTFNTHTAKHTFCATCGVQSFYHPRSNPDGVGVTLSCLIPSVPVVRAFDGQNWEQYYAGAGSAIKSFSNTER
eukprot:GSChrysophyteH1.ASY1.ANO1.688.1 assembled CDS